MGQTTSMGYRSTKGKRDMDTPTNDRPLLDEEVWQAWIQKCKQREEATTEKFKKLARIALPILAVAAVYCLLVFK
jgi:hypothetical protein